MAIETEDYLYLEPLLVDRIKTEVAGLKAVLTAPDLAAIEESAQTTPAAHVIYLGDEIGTGPGDQGGNGKAQLVTQLWAVVVAVYYADPSDTGRGNRRAAGPLISKVLRSLAGWQPEHATEVLKRAPLTIKASYANGYGYYPFVFRAKFFFK